MSIKSIFNLYSIIILGVILAATSVFIYVRYQNSINQTVEKKYNSLTESEKDLVNKNIKEEIAQQKQKRLSEAQKEKKDSSQHSSDDATTVVDAKFNPDNVKAEYVNKRPEFMEGQSNGINAKKSKQQAEEKTDIDVRSASKIPEGLQFDPRDLSNLGPNIPGSGREFNVGSKEELIKLIAEWENSDDPKKKALSKSLKEQVDKLGDNVVNMKIVIAD